MNKESACAIVVLYNPELDTLESVLGSFSKAGFEKLYLIDNSSVNQLEAIGNFCLKHLSKLDCTYKPLLNNVGIASAQNIGIELAMKDGFKYAIFFDQDSIIITKDFLNKAITIYEQLNEIGVPVASIGPRIVDRRKGKKYYALLDRGNELDAVPGSTEVKQLISSGSVVSIDVFKKVGLFEGELFIDFVDFEWCWRAYNQGFKHFIVDALEISHEFGLNEHRIGRLKMSVPSPFRCFYIYRNYLWLLKRNYIPLHWKMVSGIKLVFKLFYYFFVFKKRIEYLQNILSGIKYGISK
jgi:rhamnosyltransferase